MTTTARAAAVRIRRTTLEVTGSRLGPDSDLPAFTALRALPDTELGADASPQMRRRVHRGRLTSPLPYALQRDYDRADRALSLTAVELDNGVLRATVLPSLGGRVWSLRDLRHDRELLFVNPRLRFADFGLTDAWFAGGIEWNLGSTGHTCLSSRPVHAAVVAGPLGPALRLWEWERTRDLVLQVDLSLDDDRLLACTRVLNPDPEPKPLYYWTNVAVTETPGTRVLTGAARAWRTSYTGRLDLVDVPHPDDDTDVCRPLASRHAADYFFEVGEQEGRHVVAVEDDGRGFAQTSTSGLVGRKLFLWGHGSGGRRWQEWLSAPGHRYAEVQAGRCTTQLEHDLLDGGASVSWVEAFTGVDLGPAAAAAPYDEACAVARRAVLTGAPTERLEEIREAWLTAYADAPPEQPALAVGSGWGGAELALRERPSLPGLPFPQVADDSAEVLGLLAGRTVESTVVPPVSTRWRAALAQAPDGWWTHYARGVQAQHGGDLASARAHYLASLGLGRTAPVLRCLALVSPEADAVDLYTEALGLDPASRGLATELLELLLAAGDHVRAGQVLGRLPAPVRRHGRIRLLEARVRLAAGAVEEAAAILDDLEVEDLAEGGLELAELWATLHPGVPVPTHLDFAMSENRTAPNGGSA